MSSLLHPWLLLIALLVPPALLLRLRRGAPAVRFGPGIFLRGRRMPRGWKARLTALPTALFVGGILLAIVAAARPVERIPVPVEKEGIDLLLAIDTSSSMAAKDMAADRTRLDVAKAAAARFVEERPDDRIGLLTFAKFPDLRCPLTMDHDALGRLLGAVELIEVDAPEDATGIGTAVAKAAQVLGGSVSKSRVVILLTDGEENVATAGQPEEIAPLHAGQLCEMVGVKVFAVAAGLGDRDRDGNWTPLDTKQVRLLADRTDGRFFEARDESAVAKVYREIDTLTKAPFAEPRFETEERFLPFLAAALVLLLLARVLESRFLVVLP